ncbi:HET-domain-containing protein [Mollisia scopiformis]|uniref:HET-domain-containing protein n=1 Tax=Mollisia scopiformis TaxID=149040 RepID=A0A194XL05_MOLSC|nr:HET-domain-containing protein [Mollisia scopiformis]KUJ20858.1 HET-domain-containing protein [Mollisia scopiformis]
MTLPYFLLQRHGLRFQTLEGSSVERTTTSNSDLVAQSTKIHGSKKCEPQPPSDGKLCSYCTELMRKASKDRDDGKDGFRHYALLTDLRNSSADCSMCFALLQTFDPEDVAAAILPILEHEVWRLACRDKTFNFFRYSARVRNFTLGGLYRSKKDFREKENGDEYCSGRTLVFCIGDGPVSRRPFWTSGSIPDAFFERITTPVLSEWIKDCNEGFEHAACHSRSENVQTPLPTRVLDVGPFLSGIEAKVILSSGRTGRYIALSHCWGTHQPLTTTSASLPERMVGISQEQLPPTFWHAIQVTRKLGIKYLWIDSLCIIQGDREDWGSEAVKMGDVYHNAYITIAAAAATNSLGGLFWPCKQASSFYADEGVPIRWKCQDRTHSTNIWPIYDSPLGRRAWTLQEALLSTRVIHFGEDQLYWECASKRCSEDGAVNVLHEKTYLSLRPSKDTPITFAMLGGAKIERVHANWMSMAMTYSRRQITQLGDKIPALVGITAFSKSLTGDFHLLGLWRSTLHADLLWQIPKGDAKAMPSDIGLPSWSWLSVNGAIDYPEYFSRSNPEMELIRSHIEWTGVENVSRISIAELVISGRLNNATLLRGTGKRPTKGTRKGAFTLQMRNETHNSMCIGKARVDCDDGIAELSVWCLLVQTTPENGKRPRYFEVLLLDPVDIDGGKYRRVGTGAFRDSKELWNRQNDESSGVSQLLIAPFDGVKRIKFVLI